MAYPSAVALAAAGPARRQLGLGLQRRLILVRCYAARDAPPAAALVIAGSRPELLKLGVCARAGLAHGRVLVVEQRAVDPHLPHVLWEGDRHSQMLFLFPHFL